MGFIRSGHPLHLVVTETCGVQNQSTGGLAGGRSGGHVAREPVLVVEPYGHGWWYAYPVNSSRSEKYKGTPRRPVCGQGLNLSGERRDNLRPYKPLRCRWPVAEPARTEFGRCYWPQFDARALPARTRWAYQEPVEAEGWQRSITAQMSGVAGLVVLEGAGSRSHDGDGRAVLVAQALPVDGFRGKPGIAATVESSGGADRIAAA